MSNPRPPNHTPTKQENYRSSLHVGTNISLFSTTTTPTQSTPNFSRTDRPWISMHPGQHAKNTNNNTVRPPLSTSLKLSAHTPCRKISTSTTLTSSLFPCTPTAATPPNVQYAHSKIIFVPDLTLATPTFPPKNGIVSFFRP